MNSLIVKIGSSLVLAIIFAVVSVQAQSFRKYRAQIPFNFTFAQNVYPAGEYIIRVDNVYAAPLLTVENVQTRKAKQMPVFSNGSRASAEKTILRFDRLGDLYVLKQLISSDFGLSAPKTKPAMLFAKKSNHSAQSVEVILSRHTNKAE